ncbi:MAG: transcription termination/antitermination protein NusA [Bacilli bacterium]|nr:transcription termination/antitermination protein NusA [Bacilli bacterium]
MNKKQMKEFMNALNAIVAEKGIDRAIVIEAMEQAMAAAYKKKGGPARCVVNPDTGEIKLFSVRTVVEDEYFRDERSQISLTDAKLRVPDIEIGETIEDPVEMTDFGRVAAGTAKQVVVQRIKEAEKELIVNELGDKQDELVIGTLSREDSKTYYVDLGKTFGLLPKDETIPGEKLEMGSSIKAYVSKLEIGTKGVFILLSRTHYGFVKRLLEIEIPEISDGTVILYSVAREAGFRSKIAVYTEVDNIEPVGCVIGAGGSRINRVLKQIGNEKIDVILYDKDPAKFIQNALSPAKDIEVFITDYKKKEAIAIVNKDNLSLAIGKKGQNVKLASRLTHYKIEVKSYDDVNVEEYRSKYTNEIPEEEIEEDINSLEIADEVVSEETEVLEESNTLEENTDEALSTDVNIEEENHEENTNA